MSDLETSTGMDPHKYIGQFLDETRLLAAAERWTPDLLEEVKGIAEGADLDHSLMFALQLPDEEWWYRREKGGTMSYLRAERCSGLGVFGESHAAPLLGQNIDIPQYMDGLQVLLQIKDRASGLEALVVTVAGIIGLNGLNNRSVGICVNTLLQLNHAIDGLPVAFLVRGVLARSKAEDAVTFVRSVRHASGQNYIIGQPEAILDLECSANQVTQFAPYPGATRVYHTNHPLVNDDQEARDEIPERTSPRQLQLERNARSNSEARLSSLENRLQNASEPVTVETLKEVLSSHDQPQYPVCRHRNPDGGAMTIACSIMLLSASPQLHLACGPPCSTEFSTFYL